MPSETTPNADRVGSPEASRHTIRFVDARDSWPCAAETIDLVLTSPPYPMIAMWDEAFARMIATADESQVDAAPDFVMRRFELMHRALDFVWAQAFTALKPGGFLVVNIGDATRNVAGEFQLFANHARVIAACLQLGFRVLPGILWRKPTNAPNKFMGSGMLPAGAYVTLEHEHILVFRKGRRRLFASEPDKARRRSSAIFWEERNNWFSDVWHDVRGARQALEGAPLRRRSGAFPFEFACRLVHMFSLQGDTICDPFLGTGTTTCAALAGARNSVGFEIDAGFEAALRDRVTKGVVRLNETTRLRLVRHREFVQERQRAGRAPAHWNVPHDCPVVTAQERYLQLPRIARLIEERRRASSRLEFQAWYDAWPVTSGVAGETETQNETDEGPHQSETRQHAPAAMKAIGQDQYPG